MAYGQGLGQAAQHSGGQAAYQTYQANGVWWRRDADGTVWYLDNNQWVEYPSSANISQGASNDPYASQSYYPVLGSNATPAPAGGTEGQGQAAPAPASPSSTEATSGSYPFSASHHGQRPRSHRRRDSIDRYVESTRPRDGQMTTWSPTEHTNALAAIQEYSFYSQPGVPNSGAATDLDISDEAEPEARVAMPRVSSSESSRKERRRKSRRG